MLKLYTTNNCFYCKALKKNLKKWGYEFAEFNSTADPSVSKFMESYGHKTYPQLYYDGTDVQRGSSTELTQKLLTQRVNELHWPGKDGGID